MAGTTAAFLFRMRVEERALTGAFGDRYRQYQQRTARLLPGVLLNARSAVRHVRLHAAELILDPCLRLGVDVARVTACRVDRRADHDAYGVPGFFSQRRRARSTRRYVPQG